MTDALMIYKSAPFTGPFSEGAFLLDSIASTIAPYEGLWIDTEFLKVANISLEGTFNTPSIQLYGTNLDSVGATNQYVATVTDASITNGDVLTLTFKNPNFGSEAVSYTVQTSDTLTIIATALAAAINADPVLPSYGFAATSNVGVVTITFPSSPPNMNSSPSSPALSNSTSLLASKNSGATETVTITTGSNGVTIGAAITAAGLTNISPIPRYLKARLNSLTSGSVTVALQGAG